MSSKNNKVTKEVLIKTIAEENHKDFLTVKDIYNSLESKIFDLISSVDKEHDISIKLFEGVSLDAVYVPEKDKINNLTGKATHVSSKIKPKFNITRSYCEKINSK